MQINVRTRLGRAAVLVLAMGCLVPGIWGGLLRLPVAVPLPVQHANWITFHGPLMVCGFLGTLIGLERAVGLRVWWAYAAPLMTAAGAVAVAFGELGVWPRWLLAGGSGVFLAVAGRIVSIQRATHTLVMAGGAALWLGGNLVWLFGGALPQATMWWIGFLLFTIVGERIELTRYLPLPASARPWLVAGLTCHVAGLAVGLAWPRVGGWLVGVGVMGLGAWLARFDIARRTVKNRGLPRFMALCLLGGYGWLLVAGGLMLATWPQTTGYRYDAALHAFFLGFVFSMIFGHAPVIFPSVLHLPVSYHPTAYVPLGVLHLSVAVRVLGDLWDWPEVRGWGGVGNAAAVGLFLLNTVGTMLFVPRPVGGAVQSPAAPQTASPVGR